MPRFVILSTRALAVIEDLLKPARTAGRQIFPLGLHAVEYRWSKARRKAAITGLTFHDLRHEGLSRMANRGLNPGELKGQSGHRSPEILLRYLNARPAEVAKKLG
jgi:integrase